MRNPLPLTEENMRKPTFTTRRVLGAVLATALAVAGTVALANTSDAATSPAVTLTPASGSAAGGDIVTVKGSGFMDSSNASLVAAVRFLTSACGTDATAGTGATAFNVTSATKAVVTTPSLAAGTWYLCLFDGTGASGVNVLGQAKFVTGTAPAGAAITPVTSTVLTASSQGGTLINVGGTNFTKKAVVYVDGVAAKTTYVSATKVTALAPAHAAGTGYRVKVTTEYGSATDTTNTVTYTAVIVVSPTAGGTASGKGVEIDGVGFNALTFGSAVSTYVVAFVPAGTSVAAAAAVPSTLCTSIVVESDTVLDCKTPALSGAYTVRILQRDSSTATNIGSATTALSRSATYTAADI